MAGIPVLYAAPAGKRERPLSCIIFYRGFTSSNLVYSYFAAALARAGFRVVMSDASDHGVHLRSDAKVRMHRFWHTLQQDMRESITLRVALVTENWLSDGQLTVGGASMGGMTALGIMARHPEVKCVAGLMSSGYFTRLTQTLLPPSLVQTPEQQAEFGAVIASLTEWGVTHQSPRLADRSLLLWHGQDDGVVPAVEAFRLQQTPIQAGLDNDLTCLREAGVRHRITPGALATTVTFLHQRP